MTIPFVIDNQHHKMADVLNDLLHHHRGHSLDVATAYFNVGGWQLLLLQNQHPRPLFFPHNHRHTRTLASPQAKIGIIIQPGAKDALRRFAVIQHLRRLISLIERDSRADALMVKERRLLRKLLAIALQLKREKARAHTIVKREISQLAGADQRDIALALPRQPQRVRRNCASIIETASQAHSTFRAAKEGPRTIRRGKNQLAPGEVEL